MMFADVNILVKKIGKKLTIDLMNGNKLLKERDKNVVEVK